MKVRRLRTERPELVVGLVVAVYVALVVALVATLILVGGG